MFDGPQHHPKKSYFHKKFQQMTAQTRYRRYHLNRKISDAKKEKEKEKEKEREREKEKEKENQRKMKKNSHHKFHCIHYMHLELVQFLHLVHE